MTEHPITPPPELVEQWKNLPEYTDGRRKMIMVTLSRERLLGISTQAAQYGADQELEACCDWLHWQNLATHSELIPSLRAARRPKPKPLSKEEALDELYISFDRGYLKKEAADIIRRALEQLDD